MRPSHLNIGPYQVIWWPRWRFCFWRSPYLVYRWVVYVWPLELRRFEPKPTGAADDRRCG